MLYVYYCPTQYLSLKLVMGLKYVFVSIVKVALLIKWIFPSSFSWLCPEIDMQNGTSTATLQEKKKGYENGYRFYAVVDSTLYQMKNFRLVQIKNICRQKIKGSPNHRISP